LEVLVRAPPFAPVRALRDNTTYALDLAALRGASGAALQPDGLDDDALVFTTGVLDGLLNHSCGHVLAGPFAARSASAVATDAPDLSTGHVRTTLSLAELGNGHGGYVVFQAAPATRLTLFLDRAVALSWVDGARREVAVVQPAAAACPGIVARTSTTFSTESTAVLLVEPQDADVVNLIVEWEAI
jgi:hypothetical protein